MTALLLPTIGTIAYPVQIIYSATGKQSRVAQLIVYDVFTHIGSKIPAWGGTEKLPTSAVRFALGNPAGTQRSTRAAVRPSSANGE